MRRWTTETATKLVTQAAAGWCDLAQQRAERGEQLGPFPPTDTLALVALVSEAVDYLRDAAV